MKSKRRYSPSGGPKDDSPPAPPWFRGVRVFGLGGLFAALAASLGLSLERLAGIGLPGCGPGGGCGDAAASFFGSLRVAGLAWPVSHLGVAFYAALGTLVVARGESRGIARVGGAAAIFFLIVSAVEGILCFYCFVAHSGALLYLVSLELMRPSAKPRRSFAIAGAAFVIASLALGAAEWASAKRASQQAERDLDRSVRQAVEAPPQPLFTGRYRIGPEDARVRIVVFSDFQCRDCQWLDREIASVLASRSDVSYSPKHFPFCRDCNPHVPRTLHANACWAARAAEAGGILAGADGFFRVHRWLFERGGSFTDAELRSALRDMNFDEPAFLNALTSDATLALVKADVEEAMALGLSRTPLVYINGVEVRGWQTPGAIARAAAEVAAAAPAGPDRPPGALEKFAEDWAAQPVVLADAFSGRHIAGEGDRRIVVFGDYQDPGTALVDRAARALAAARPGVRYEFAHYPADSKCNPAVATAINPFACAMARAAEAAALIGGDAAFRAAHAHLLGEGTPQERLGSLGAATEISPEALSAAVQDDLVRAVLAAHIDAGRALGLTEIPTIFIGGRRVPRWNAPNAGPEQILGSLLEREGK